MGIKPLGKGSFGLSDLAPGAEGLRVVQIHGEHDPLDSTEWLGHLNTPHQLKIYPGGWHFFKDGPPDFLKLLAPMATNPSSNSRESSVPSAGMLPTAALVTSCLRRRLSSACICQAVF
jgi:hypothetical protein